MQPTENSEKNEMLSLVCALHKMSFIVHDALYTPIGNIDGMQLFNWL